ncbi:tail fiber domain-containing protein [Phenylobacterium sp.]|uniref:tail fiber domain-containing protein n=1 Tax=Phenylobacterium sp. TaxID=1871053 RepID=UPI000C8E9EBD|nr:tail fiber domain-containing protein [Phenylobacterium sp.]MAK80458.1 hypothetical protein [Phenylobacterium sp.]
MANYAATIKAQVDGTPGSDDMPGRLIFSTTADGGTSSTERMRITSDGKVGIGGTPLEPLDIILNTTSRRLLFRHTNSVNTIQSANASSNNEAVALSGDNIRFHTGSSGTGSEIVRMDSNGRVLISQTSARASGGVSGMLQVERADSNGAINIVQNQNSAAGAPVLILGKSRGTSIGSNTVVADNDTLGTINFAGADGTDLNTPAASISCAVDGTPGSDDMPGRLIFSTTADGASSVTERMRIDSGGDFKFSGRLNVVNGASSILKLGVESGDFSYRVRANVSSSVNGGFLIEDGNSLNDLYKIVSGSSGSHTFFIDGSTKMTLSSVGSLLVANTGTLNIGDGGAILGGSNNIHYFARNAGTGSAVLWIKGGSGQAYFLGDGDLVNTNNNYGGISDQNLKENIVDANSQWDDIKALKIRNYNFKESTKFSTHRQIGVIAQELEASGMNGLVRDHEEGHKSVDYSVLYMKAIKALQEGMTKIETLETKVAALEAG